MTTALAFSPSVLPLFNSAGWNPERSVPLPQALERSVPKGHPALGVLRSLAGLHVGTTGAGVECAKSDLDFGWLGEDERPDVTRWAKTLGTRLVGIARVHHDHGSLYVASDGRCFGFSDVDDSFYFEGASLAEAAELLLLGRRSRPILSTNQQHDSLHGFRFARSSPEVCSPESAQGSKARPVRAPRSDAQSVVSLWLGHAKSVAVFDGVLVAEFSEDGDFLGSPFSRGFRVEYYEDATRETVYFETARRSLPVMLTGCSYGEAVIPRFESLPVRLAATDNCAVLLYGIEFSGTPSHWSTDGLDLRFEGSVKYER